MSEFAARLMNRIEQLAAENAVLKARVADLEKALNGVEPHVADLLARLKKAEDTIERTASYAGALGACHRQIGELEGKLAEAERVLRICAHYPPAGMRPQDKKPFFSGFIPAEQRAAREYFAARTTDREGASHE